MTGRAAKWAECERIDKPVHMRTEEQKQFLLMIFTTAIEGGIGYWSVTEEYHWMKPGSRPGADKIVEPAEDLDGFYAVLTSSEKDWGWDKTVYQPQRGSSDGQVYIDENTALRIDIDVVERGANMLVDKVIAATKSEDPGAPFSRKYLRQFVIQWLTECESGDSDADVADMVVQLGLFGEVVYA